MRCAISTFIAMLFLMLGAWPATVLIILWSISRNGPCGVGGARRAD